MTAAERVKALTAPNADTACIKCVFNVKQARKELLKYANDVFGATYDMKFGSIKAQYAYTAITETLALYMIRSAGKFSTKNATVADLYEVNYENIQRAIRESKELNAEMRVLSEEFKPASMNYTSSFFVPEKIMKVYLEDKAQTNTTNVHINKDALNFMYYMLSHIMSSLTHTACLFSKYAKKSNITFKNYRFACEDNFRNESEISKLLTQRLDEVEYVLTTISDDSSKNKKKDDSSKSKTTEKADDTNDTENNDDDDDDNDNSDASEASDDEIDDENDDDSEDHTSKKKNTKSNKKESTGSSKPKTNTKKRNDSDDQPVDDGDKSSDDE